MLQALAQALQSHIQVFSVGLPVLELGEEFKGELCLGCWLQLLLLFGHKWLAMCLPVLELGEEFKGEPYLGCRFLWIGVAVVLV